MVFTELNPGSPPPPTPAVPEELVRTTNITRSQSLIELLQENDSLYAYLDDPDNRWIISIEPWTRGLGHFAIYYTDTSNIATHEGHALVGHQDTVRTLIQRGWGRAVEYDTPVDLTPIIQA